MIPGKKKKKTLHAYWITTIQLKVPSNSVRPLHKIYWCNISKQYHVTAQDGYRMHLGKLSCISQKFEKSVTPTQMMTISIPRDLSKVDQLLDQLVAPPGLW